VEARQLEGNVQEEERQSNGFHLQWDGESVACPHTCLSLTNSYTARARRSVERGNRLGFPVTSPNRIHGRCTCAHSSTVMGDVLSSLPPLRRGVKLGWRACYGFASVYGLPCPLGYTALAVPPIRHDTSRCGCSPAPGVMGMSPRTLRDRILSSRNSSRHPKGCVHARVWQRVEWIRRGRSLHSHGSRLPTVSWLCIHLTVGRVGK
jgi:hypothetical protein